MNEAISREPISSEVADLLNENLVKSLATAVIEKYESMGLTKHQFCNTFAITRTSWDRIVQGEAKKFDLVQIAKIAEFLGWDVGELIKRYIASTAPEESEALRKIRRNVFILNHFDLKNLKKIKFINNISNFDEIEKRIKEFFLLDDIRQYVTNDETDPAYIKTRMSGSERMLRFWNRIVRSQLEQLNNPNQYDEDKLLKTIPRMRFATLDLKYGFALFRQALWECGVPVIVESYLPNTAIRGATFSYKKRPVIVLTNLKRAYHTLWFALGHELHHVIADMDEISRQGYHLSGADSLLQNELMENMANNFARRLLISDENMGTLEKHIGTPGFAELYAQKWNVHPSILYGLYLWGKPESEYQKFSKYLIKSTDAIKNIEVTDTWNDKNVMESIPKIAASWNPTTKEVELAQMPT